MHPSRVSSQGNVDSEFVEFPADSVRPFDSHPWERFEMLNVKRR
jgi:hypothetical protein